MSSPLRNLALLSTALVYIGSLIYSPHAVQAWHRILQVLERYDTSQRSTPNPFFDVYCSLGDEAGKDSRCPFVELGKNVSYLQIKLEELCDQSDPLGLGYICNTTVSPDCSFACENRRHLQPYIDAILHVNPFRGHAGEVLEPWLVPQTDLSRNGAYIFMSQRQALYLNWRTLALKQRFPNATVVTNETNKAPCGQNFTIINALEYGLTYGCNWEPSHFYLDPEACQPPRGMWTGVGKSGIQGNIFSLLAWTNHVVRENANGDCHFLQPSHTEFQSTLGWCPHDSVIGAVRGGKSGPDARSNLDNLAFWRSRMDLGDVGIYPNVCHFEESAWVWRNELDQDAVEKRQTFCKGFGTVPDAYGADVADFMSIDRPGSLTVDIAGAQYGGGCGSASGETYSTQDESLPVFYPETVALGFNSRNRSISTGSTSLIFFGVRRYFSGQSGSHGVDYEGLKQPLFNHGSPCGDLKFAKIMPLEKVLNATVLTSLKGRRATHVKMYKHSVGVFTSSCGTCADGNLPTTNSKYKTVGQTCLVEWFNGRSGCKHFDTSSFSWTYWMDVWIWVGALWPDFYPDASRQVFRDLVERVGTGPWGAGVWWGNTLQYFVITWLATALLWDRAGAGPQLDYYAYGVAGQRGPPLGGFCEQYQAQGYEDVVRRLPQIQSALQARLSRERVELRQLFAWLQTCSRCSSNCTFPGVGPTPADVYCTSPCTDDFLSCFVHAIEFSRKTPQLAQQFM